MMDKISLNDVLEVFNVPLSEEQAWAVCFQCAIYLRDNWSSGCDRGKCAAFTGFESVIIYKDGSIEATDVIATTDENNSENALIQTLGLVLYQALDYGLDEAEEHKLSPALEGLIKRMTGYRDVEEQDTINERNPDDVEGDEGIENDVDEDHNELDENGMSIEDVMQFCSAHLENPLDAGVHYKAVCRALYAEATELLTFLDKISTEKEKLRLEDDPSSAEHAHLEELQRGDWARLWIQMMHELRQGVKLRKVDSSISVRHSVEYELTPYEMLMEDIRSHRYTLNKVMVNGDIPPRTKKDAHNVMLEFIRSRPPLHPVKDRKLTGPQQRVFNPREELMNEIRSSPKLRPTCAPQPETSQGAADEADSGNISQRKVIKANFDLFLSDEDDELSDSGDDDAFEDKNKVTPSPLSPLTPLSPRILADQLPWQQTASRPDDASKIRRQVAAFDSQECTECYATSQHAVDPHSHPATKLTSFLMNNQPHNLESSLDCLSLTVEEVMHIRNVLTKAEVETLLVDPELHAMVDKGKVCFTCRKTKFSLFGSWSTKCKFCQRYVCSKCISKMQVPTEHFEHIPVYTLSPSPPGSESNFVNETGSEPSSPQIAVRSFSPSSHSTPHKTGSDPDLSQRSSSTSSHGPSPTSYASAFTKLKELARQGAQMALNNGLSDEASMPEDGASRPSLRRADTTARPALNGPVMNICSDCKAMIVGIIRASRSCLATTPRQKRDKVFSDCPSRRANRDFHLNLKPVYKPSHQK